MGQYQIGEVIMLQVMFHPCGICYVKKYSG